MAKISAHGSIVGTVEYMTHAKREYAGGIVAAITAAGHWEVRGPDRLPRIEGDEPTVICAAMEANERAWSQPEYIEARRTGPATMRKLIPRVPVATP